MKSFYENIHGKPLEVEELQKGDHVAIFLNKTNLAKVNIPQLGSNYFWYWEGPLYGIYLELLIIDVFHKAHLLDPLGIDSIIPTKFHSIRITNTENVIVKMDGEDYAWDIVFPKLTGTPQIYEFRDKNVSIKKVQDLPFGNQVDAGSEFY